ncbi:MAG: hypothetical protein J6Y62_01420 [Clostridia bacterium]|nr:hypothetical protein [Clostridia bacterium]
MRYGRPWLAVLTLQDGKLKYTFLNDAFQGDELKGGRLVIDSEDCFLAYGQKDYLCEHSTAWIGMAEAGRLTELSPKAVKARLEKEKDHENSEREADDGVRDPRGEQGAEAP